MTRLFWLVYLWIKLWWLVNMRGITPADMHNSLTKRGYACEYKATPTGYIRKYTNQQGGEIEIKVNTLKLAQEVKE